MKTNNMMHALREGLLGGVVIGWLVLPIVFACLYLGYLILKYLSGVGN